MLEEQCGTCLNKIECDLALLEEVERSLDQFNKNSSVLILSAGYGQFGGLEQFSHSQIQQLINTNLVSNFYILKHFLPLFKSHGGGDIVLIGSESALQGARAGAVYCATKFALRGLAQSLRADCSNSNIRVHLINPGPVDSAFFDNLSFEPYTGDEFSLKPYDVAQVVIHALTQPRHIVYDEVNVQPMKRSFQKKK